MTGLYLMALERPTAPTRGRLNGPVAALLATTALVAVTALLPDEARAQNATWLASPGSGDFNTDANWSPASVPIGTAFFGASSVTSLSFSGMSTTLDGFTFDSGASAYTFTNSTSLTLRGAGIAINGGSASITNNGGNFLYFYNSSTAGSASITNNNGGFLMFHNSSTAGSATITNNGGVYFNNSGTAGSASITNNANLFFYNSSTAGNATITNNAALSFHDTSTAGSASITNNNGNFLYFYNSSTAGNASITNNATLSFYDTSTAGTARLINGAGGLIDLTSVTSGGITAGSIEGGGNINLGANNLTVGGNNLSTAFSGVIGGSGGSLTKTGTGMLTLTGVNTYSGATTINGGTLEVDGSIASSSSVTVNSGGTLTGTGIVDPVAATTIASGGTFAPGAPGTPGTFTTISGNLAFQSGATYAVSLNPSASTYTVVTGTASLAGTVSASFAPGSYVAHQYDILRSAGLGGTTFNALTTSNLPAGFASSLSYTSTDVLLNLTVASLGAGAALPGNQQNVANAISSFFNNGGSLPPGFVTLFGLAGNNLSNALSQVSGETATGSQQITFNAMGMFMGLLTDPFIDGRGDGVSAGSSPGASAYASQDTPRSGAARDANAMFTKAPVMADPFAQRWSVWAAGFGGSQTTDGNAALGGSNSTTSRIYGTAVGADYRFSPFTIAGFALAGGGTNFSVVNSGSGRSDLFQAGAFIRHNAGAAYISGALAYGWQDITTNRTVTIAGFDQLRAEFNANAFSGRAEGGYRFVSPWMGGVGITPYAAGQFTTFDLPAYAEQAVTGANTFALAYGARSVTDPRSELGLRSDKSYAMQDGILTLRGRAAWAHDFNPDRNIGATFQTLPGASFVVNGAAQASDSALVTASAEMKWLNGWSTAATFEGEFSQVTTSYAGKGVVRYLW